MRRPHRTPHPLQPVPSDASPSRPPTRDRPVRSRGRALAMHAHIEPHQHAWSQFTYCASGLMQVTVTQDERETTFIVPPSRAVWIAPQVQHNVVVLESAELVPWTSPPGLCPQSWTDCRVLVVSTLLRELIARCRAAKPASGKTRLMALTLDEIRRADIQTLGVPMPHPVHGDRRLRTLCEAVLRDPAENASCVNGWPRWAPASARWPACSARNWAPATSSGAPRRVLGTCPAQTGTRHAHCAGCCRQRLRQRQRFFCHVQAGHGPGARLLPEQVAIKVGATCAYAHERWKSTFYSFQEPTRCPSHPSLSALQMQPPAPSRPTTPSPLPRA